ncbi:hypothetical protein DFH06DRAFT_1441136 [Mycena polygramma]|nr:hypothetical protein DFH06DRAFT_1441136 [Mycena polygramma]
MSGENLHREATPLGAIQSIGSTRGRAVVAGNFLRVDQHVCHPGPRSLSLLLETLLDVIWKMDGRRTSTRTETNLPHPILHKSVRRSPSGLRLLSSVPWFLFPLVVDAACSSCRTYVRTSKLRKDCGKRGTGSGSGVMRDAKAGYRSRIHENSAILMMIRRKARMEEKHKKLEESTPLVATDGLRIVDSWLKQCLYAWVLDNTKSLRRKADESAEAH